MPSNVSAPEALHEAETAAADSHFWLSRIDDAIPRISIVPDFKRTTEGRHVYRSVSFSLDPDVVRVLKSVDKTRGLSDLVLCATLVGAVLAKYQREDEFTIGLRTREAPAAGRATVVPLRIECAREQTVLTLMRVVGDEIASVLRHSPCTVHEMAQILGVELIPSQCPFFNVALAVGDAKAGFDFDTYPVDLAFCFEGGGGLLKGRVTYAEDLFEAATMEHVVSHLLHAARQISERPNGTLAELDVVPADERHRILTELSGHSVRFPLDKTLHALFEEQADRTPDAMAAIDGETRLTYAELNARANRLARTLLALGLEKRGFVGIFLKRGCDFVTAMLAVFKAGGAYVPLDPSYPSHRVRYMLDDSQAALVVSNAALVNAFRDGVPGGEHVRVIVCIDSAVDMSAIDGKASTTVVGPERVASMSGANLALPLTGRDRAYMIYTSGSTGRPKGAICRHDGALNHLYGELAGIKVDGAFRFLQTAASSSDISVWQFVAPLLFGGATVIVDYDVVVDPIQLFAAVKEHQVTVAELVPVVLRALLDYVFELPSESRRLADLRAMMATGEALAPELVDRWLALYPEIPVANTYGPTETSDDVTLAVIRKPLGDRRAIVPIGRPLPNNSIFLLDRDLRPVPIGGPGEICIAGIGVGEGYWRQPDKTATAFVPCPFPEISAGPMYRTGDLARWLPDGSIEFLGRCDYQVKIRGFRVEPGEVEAALTGHAGVRDAAVVAVDDASGNTRLVAYFVTHKDASLAPAELRQFLKGSLAEQMIPAALVPMSALPLTPLGKIDRRALSRNEYLEAIQRDDYVAPRNEVESILAAAWSRVLGVRNVGIHDNFFELGGDSILTIHVIAELKSAGLTVAPKQFFLHPTIAELAEHLETATGASSSAATQAPLRAEPLWNTEALRAQLTVTYPDLADVYPLAPTQRGIYFQSILPAKSSGAYIEQISFDLIGHLDEKAFASAWQHAVMTTDTLRTAIVRRGVPQPMQVVVRPATLVPRIQDWRRLSPTAGAPALEALIIEDRQKGFDMGTPPLTRVTLTRLADDRWNVLWTYHHVVLDGWSEPLVLADVFNAYDALVDGKAFTPPPTPGYRTFVAWADAQDEDKARDFWRKQLAGFVSPSRIKDESPAIDPPASGQLSHGWTGVHLSEAETTGLDEMARRNKLTLSTILHGAWAMLLHRRTASPDVVFGSVASGRQSGVPDIGSVRGVVVVTQPLRTRSVPDATVSAWLRVLQLQMAEIREFEHTPLASIQQWCDVPPENRPIFDSLVVMANYLGSDLAHCHPSAMEIANVAYVTQPLYALTLFVLNGERMAVRIVYDKRRYAPATVNELLGEYVRLLAAIAENPERRLASTLTSQ